MNHWYYKLLAEHPKLIVLSVLILSSVCIFVSVFFKALPDFSDPSLGFEARGTDIAKKLTAWQNLVEETRPSGKLTSNPFGNVPRPLQEFVTKRRHDKTLNNKKNNNRKKNVFNDNKKNNSSHARNKPNFESFGENDTKFSNKRKRKKHFKSTEANAELKDDYFCDAPRREYAHFVIERIGSKDLSNISLFDADAIGAMCDLETKLTAINEYKNICEEKVISKQCCRPWSIPNYFAALSNKTNCAELKTEDIINTTKLLANCYEYYQNGSLKNDCKNFKCFAPNECAQFNAVYNIFHFLADNKINGTNLNATSVMLFLPIAKSASSLPYYYEINSSVTSNHIVSIVAIDMGLKNALFDDLLYCDAWLISLGVVFISYLILIYTNSCIITISMILANVIVIGDAYFLYQIVFQLPYFPFMNLLAVIVIIGIGADDCFVYMKEWRASLNEWNATNDRSSSEHQIKMIFLVSNTMRHTAKSIFVTSITTAHAFYASYFSTITAIRCFGIFAGTAVTVNYIIMMTWLPAIVVIVENNKAQVCSGWRSYVENLNANLDEIGKAIQRIITRFVKKFAYLFVAFFLLIGIASSIIVLYYPKFGLPDNQAFQLFKEDHPFELYDTKYRNMFWFEKSFVELETFNLPIRFVWGVDPIDDGNYLIPTSHGSLHLKNNFTVSSIEAQLWILNFCASLKQQSFYQPNNIAAILPSCFIENLVENMNKRCFDEMTGKNRTCCEQHKFPYESSVFDECLPEVVSSLYNSPRYIFVPGVAGPKFEKKPFSSKTNQIAENETKIQRNKINIPSIKALVIEYESTQPFTTSYPDINNFQNAVQRWFENISANAPLEMQNGWFTSELSFYDLQEMLQQGTITAASIAMISSLIVLLLFTMNLLVSAYAALTVTFTIFTSIATLILLGWKLNILESITASTAVGLGIDFALHYGINYRLSTKNDRKNATEYALSRMIGPTAMAALTTVFAGVFMLFSNVIAYIKIGLFLIIVMTVSWLYATFFFTSLLYTIGPENNFGQFVLFKRSKKLEGKQTKQIQPASESLISANYEMQELSEGNTNQQQSPESNTLIARTEQKD